MYGERRTEPHSFPKRTDLKSWINGTTLETGSFEWADEYYGVSVGISQIDRVREYIRNQQKHLRRKSWADRCAEFAPPLKLRRHADCEQLREHSLKIPMAEASLCSKFGGPSLKAGVKEEG